MVDIRKLLSNKGFRAFLLEAAFVLLLALALGHAGPYGTYEKFELVPRLAYWVLVIGLPWGLAKLLFTLARQFGPANLSTTFISVFLTPVLAIVGSALTTLINMKVGLHAEHSFTQIWPFSIVVWLIFGFLIVLPMVLLGSALAREQRKAGVTTMMEFFHYKLPDKLKGGQLIALKAEDHYLRVFTDVGNALISMKFEDALAALNGYPGIQTHRSWWVASSQLKGLTKISASTLSIALDDGTQAPVSRRKRRAVNEHISAMANKEEQ